MTAIEGSAVSIEVAKAHAQQSGVQVDYRHNLVEELLAQGDGAVRCSAQY